VKNINQIAFILLVCWALLLIAGVGLLARQFFLKWDRDGDERPKRREDEPPE
jgi:hypothetical protein